MLFTSPSQSHNSDSNRNRKGKVRRRATLRNSARRSSFSPRFEPLEDRAMMATLAVDIGDAGCGDAGDNLYCEIQDAIDVAESGDSILVRDGTYDPISIDKNDLTIAAVGAGDVIIDVDAVLDNTLPPEPGVALNADGVTIKGLTVTDARGYGIFVTGDHNTLQQNVVSNTSEGPARVAHGIFLIDANHNTLIGNTALNNDRMGFEVDRSDYNTLRNNLSSGNGVNGFQVGSRSDFNTFVDNQAVDNNNGFTLANNEGNTLHGNMAESNNFRGFFLVFFPKNTILEGNTARDNGRSGFNLAFDASSNTLRGNRAEGNGTEENPDDNFGFVLSRESNNNILQGNIATGNTGEGFVVADSSFNTLQGNIAKWNGEGGFLLTDVKDGGFLGGDTASNTFKANTALENGGNGYTVVGNEDKIYSNVFQDNSAVTNDEYGFFVDEAFADDNVFDNNDCVLNGLGDSNIADIC